MSFGPVDFLEDAVPIDSTEDVSEMRDFLVSTLAEHGVEATVDDAGNTVAARGTGGPHVLLNTHVDTVPPHVPYERGTARSAAEETSGETPRVDGDVIRGRGSCDAKGPLAALLSAFLGADLSDGNGRLTLAVSPDEETLSTGAAALDLDDLDPDWCIVGEPTGLDVCNAAKGRFQGTIALSGENAHAAEPQEGTNAVDALEEVLRALETFDDRDDAPPAHDSLGAATLTPTTVAGGSATNQIPAECELVVDRRSVPPETSEGFRSSLEAHLRERVPDDVGVSFDLTDRESPFLEAFSTPADDPLVTALRGAAGGDVRPFTAATEASYFAAVAPTVVFGPGDLADEAGAVAHADREYVRVDEVRRAADALAAALGELLG
ncbi:M20 family metallopeptidase [Halostella sp. JP-L12]|uniref:M20 family metallopeptidase n=1 Tax=Halostella TaxID=1843185 RepID=UPI000EF78912|nr:MULTISPECIES: M20 family metallopeptidase [Halostella]NHN47657.1 M20 family metallopeptidase [Halostella sp. JP-L12]